jgi:hypothetical protein
VTTPVLILGVTALYVMAGLLGQVAFHASSLRRVMVNLMQNVLEAMEHGGT